MRNIPFNLIFSVLMAACILICPLHAFEPPVGFLGDSDVPLAEGLSVEEGDETDFDAPQGRIVEYKTFGKTDAPHLMAFYESALPALGWTLIGKTAKKTPMTLQYKRDQDVLDIEFIDADSGNNALASGASAPEDYSARKDQDAPSDDTQVIFRLTSGS